MARGWESKSVEMQIEERSNSTVPACNTPEDAEQRRKLELLELSRRRLVHEIEAASDPRLRALKQKALDHIEQAIRSAR
jgi:hypothetical protein